MAARARNNLTPNQNRVLKAVASGVVLRQDRKQRHLAIVPAKDGAFKTHIRLVQRLLLDGLFLQNGDNIFDVEITQRGLAKLDEFPGFPKSRLPEVLHPTVRPIALQKIAELRRIGFEDAVDGLLAIAFETDEEGEFVNDLAIRIDCLKGAAPFCRPKLQAILARSDSGKGHAEWLKELKGYVEQEECEVNGEDGPVIEHATANGNDPEPLAPEPGEPKDGEAVSEPAEPNWKPQSK